MYNGSFFKAKKRSKDSMFLVVRKSRKLSFFLSLQLHLFDPKIVLIYEYSCEVLETENLNL